MQQTVNPKVGVGVLVIHKQTILLGRRIASHGKNSWQPPGGHLEFGETPEACAKRELFEETGLVAQKAEKLTWTSDFFPEDHAHYISLFMLVTHYTGTPNVKEPEKCAIWRWFPIKELPNGLFLPLQNLIQEASLTQLIGSTA